MSNDSESKRMGHPTAEELATALAKIDEELGIDPAVTVNGDLLKCWVYDDEGPGRGKRYFEPLDCAALAEAFDVLARHLRPRRG